MDHGEEARRLVGLIQQEPDRSKTALSAEAVCGLAQVHGLRHLADRVDYLAEVVAETAGT